jgi:hypothetical protein
LLPFRSIATGEITGVHRIALNADGSVPDGGWRQTESVGRIDLGNIMGGWGRSKRPALRGLPGRRTVKALAI